MMNQESNEKNAPDGCNNAVQANAGRSEPTVAVPAHAAQTSFRQAEAAVNEINARLRDAEQTRDNLARRLGAQQDMVDRLLVELEYLSRHVRLMEHVVKHD
jgi:hypothetical protein